MFKGLGVIEISFSFSNGVVTGQNYSFDLRGPLNGATSAALDFYRASPQQLIHYVYEDWNKKFNPECILAGGNLNLGVTWDVNCLQIKGTPNPLSAAGMAIQTAVADWGRAYLGAPTTSPPPGTYTPPPPPPSTPPPSGNGGGGSNGGGFALPTNLIWIGAAVLVVMLIMKR